MRVCADLCSTCIFRPGNLMHLAEGRVKDMVESATADGEAGSIVCHDTLGLPSNAICRGFWNSYRSRVALLQLAERIDFVKYIETPAP